MANRWTTQFVGTYEKKQVDVFCNFVIDPANGNGLGVRSLKGGGVANVFGHTTASFSGTVASGSPNITGIASGTAALVPGTQLFGTNIPTGALVVAILSGNSVQMSVNASGSATETILYGAPGSPMPAAGTFIVQFQDNYNRSIFGTFGFVSQLSGANISISTGSSLTVGNPYVITSVGTSTVANWNAVGVPVGIVPAPGVAFIATATSGLGSGTVQAPSNSGITAVETIGDPNLTITSQAATVLGKTSGAYIVFQTLSGGAVTAPASGSVMSLEFVFSNSVIKVQGQ